MKMNTIKTMAGMLMLCVAGLALSPSQVSAGPMGPSYGGPFDGPFDFYDMDWPPFGDDPAFDGLQFFGDFPVHPNVTFNPAPLFDPTNQSLLFQVHGRSLASNDFTSFANDVNQVPEPASMLLIGTGLLGLAARARKRLSSKTRA